MTKLFAFLIGGAAVLGTPLFVIISAVTLLLMTMNEPNAIPFRNMFSQVFGVMGSEPYFVAIPLFTFAGYLLAESRAPQRLVAFSRSILGWLPGGTAIVALCCCAFFTAFTGASGVTIIALGGFLLPALTQERYREKFNLGLLTTGGSLGLLFPPSLPLIIYGMIAAVTLKGTPDAPSVKIDTLFVAGLIPGVLLLAVLGAYSAFTAQRSEVPKTPFAWRQAGRNLRRAGFEIAIPVLVAAALYSGKIAIQEIAPLTAMYVLIIEVFVYRDVPLRRLPEIALRSMKLVGAILIILIAAFGFNNALTNLEVPKKLLAEMEGFIGGEENRLLFLLLLNVFLLIIGCLLDVFSALLLVVPLLVPLALKYGVDPVHLGVIFLTNLEIGYSTPPVGMNLFIASLRFKKPVVQLYAASIPWLLLLVVCLLLVTYIPALSLWLPETLGFDVGADVVVIDDP